MLSLNVNVEDAGALSGIEAITAAMADRAGMHAAMADRVTEQVREHVRGLDSRSPNTHWWSRVAESVRNTSSAEQAEVVVPYRGAALRYYGGTVEPVNVKNLALPTENVPVRDNTRLAPREAGILAFIPNRKGGDTTGYLVEGEMRQTKRGKNKGKERAVPKQGGALMYILRKKTTHQADPTVLPTLEALLQAAGDAAADFIASYEGGVA